MTENAFSETAASLLRHVPADCAAIADRGPQAASRRALYLRQNPRTRYLALGGEALPPGSAPECLIYDGVPESVLPDLIAADLPALADDGLVVLSLPNLQHWQSFQALMAGRPPAPGMSQESALDLVRRLGLVPYDVQPLGIAPEGDAFLQALMPAAQAAGLNVPLFIARARGERLLVRAGKAPLRPIVLQAMTLRPVAACNDVRIDLPLGLMARRPGTVIDVHPQEATLNVAPEVRNRIFIWHRPIHTAGDLPRLRQVLARGYLMITEFDDHPMVWPTIAEHDHLTFRGVHAVQTSTPPLAGLLSEYNSEIAIFANAMASLAPLPAKAEEGPVTLFFGALNRARDWQPLLPALNAVLRSRRGLVRMGVVHDRELFEALDTGDKTFMPLSPYDTYLEALRAADINLMPLEDRAFTRMKSDIKFIESAAMGAVALASSTVYAATLKDGETGMLFHSPEEMQAALLRLIDDAPLRRRIAGQAYAYVRDERMLAYQLKARLDWYRGLLERRDELTRRLYERVPQLRP
ncbi:MAG: glycosyltransferase [Rhodospirillales bacterium]|nr:glycosyltransferase [Rhodospirillales bacterium]